MRSPSSPRAVSITIGTVEVRRSSRATSRPSRLGKPRSSTIRSGLSPRAAGEAAVERDPVGFVAARAGQRGGAVANQGHPEPRDLQVVAERSRDLHVVLNDQDLLHAGTPPRKAGGRQPVPPPAPILMRQSSEPA